MQIAIYVASHAAHAAAGKIHGKGIQRRTDTSFPVLDAGASDYKLAGMIPRTKWIGIYSLALLFFNIADLSLSSPPIASGALPFNPQNLANVSWDLAFNTAVSFMTIRMQSYAGETTLGYTVQMFGLTFRTL